MSASSGPPDDPSAIRSAGESEPDEDGGRPSRTERTRAATAVNRLGVELTTLSAADLERLDLPDRVREAVDVCRGLKPRGRGRQNRLIGQLLRAEDHESIRARLAQLKSRRRDGVRHEKVTEGWLARLLEEGDRAVEALIEAHPEADRQRLRLLTRNACTAPETRQAKRARRELLRAIRALRA